jgi:hypothetical protein
VSTSKVPDIFSAAEGYPYSAGVGDTQSKEVVKTAVGYWPCIRVPKGADERYPVMSEETGGGFFNSKKYCDLNKQPGYSQYTCRGMYGFHKSKNFPKFPAGGTCFNTSDPKMNGKVTQSVVDKVDGIQNMGALCNRWVGSPMTTPQQVWEGISDEWIVTRTKLGCPKDIWAQDAGTKDTFCNQLYSDDYHACDYAKKADTREKLHSCWDVCADTLNRCAAAPVFGLGALQSSQSFEPNQFMKALEPLETIDNWCMFLSFDPVCYPMSYYHPDGRETKNSCYPDGVNSLEAAKGLPADHAFKGTPGNFFRNDGKTMAQLVATGGGKGGKTPSGSFQTKPLVMLVASFVAVMLSM